MLTGGAGIGQWPVFHSSAEPWAKVASGQRLRAFDLMVGEIQTCGLATKQFGGRLSAAAAHLKHFCAPR